MKVELLNVRIFITKNSVIADAIGNHKNQWTEYYTCYATASGGGSSVNDETEAAGTTVSNERIDFTIRWCKKAEAIDADHYRVQFGDDLYNIVSVDYMNFKKKCIKLRCQKVRR